MFRPFNKRPGHAKQTSAKLYYEGAHGGVALPRNRLSESVHALEPRYMFDAAGVATVSEMAVEQVAENQAEQAVESAVVEQDFQVQAVRQTEQLFEALGNLESSSTRQELVFIDTSIEDYETLLAGIDASAEVILLQPYEDGVLKIAESLQGRENIDAIHIISHGDAGKLQIGESNLNQYSIQGKYAAALSIIGASLSESADIRIYGCNFGEGELGRQSLEMLSQATGADIAASDDLTGAESLGGDWELEVQHGELEHTQVFDLDVLENWNSVLVAPIAVDDVNATDSATSVSVTVSGLGEGLLANDSDPDDGVGPNNDGLFVSDVDTTGTLGLVSITTFDPVIGEVGNLTLNDAGTTLNFANDYDNAVVFAFITTENDASAAHIVRVTNVDNAADTAFLDIHAEDGTTDGINETISYIVLEAGTYTVDGGDAIIEVGTVNTNQVFGNTAAVSFSQSFTTAPTVISQVQTDVNGFDFLKTRQTGISSAGASFSLERTEDQGANLGSNETVAYFAIEDVSGDGLGSWGSFLYETAVTPDAVNDSDFAIGFSQAFVGSPEFLGHMTRVDGGDDAYLRANSLTNTGINVNVQEDVQNDGETAHTNEVVNYFAIEGSGTLRAQIIPTGDYTYDPNGAFDALAPGAIAMDTFDYTVTDADGESSTATVTITITGANELTINANDADAGEPANNGQFTVNLEQATGSDTIFTYSIGGTATGGADYTALTGTGTIISGNTSTTIDVSVLDDGLFEFGGETVVLTLTGITSGESTIAVDPGMNTATVTISDDDSPSTIATTSDVNSTDEDTTTSGNVLTNDTVTPPALTGGAFLNYEGDAGGDNLWQDNTGVGGFDFNFGALVTQTSPTTNLGNLTSAIDLTAIGAGGTTTSFDNAPAGASANDVTWDLWFRPDDFTDQDVLFETGATGDGASIILSNDGSGEFDLLQFSVLDSNSAAVISVNLSDFTGLTTTQLAAEFVNVIAVYDRDATGNTDELRVYINGIEATTANSAVTYNTSGNQDNLNDWAGGNGAGLGRESGAGGSGINASDGLFSGFITNNGFTNFEGEIAIFRHHNSTAFTATDAVNNYFNVADHLFISAASGTTSDTLTEGTPGSPNSIVITGNNGGEFTVFSDGSYTYDPNGAFENLADGASAMDSFTYTATDINGGTHSDTVTVTINGVNDAPTLDTNVTQTVDEGSTGNTITNLLLDTNDIDDADADITYTVTALPGNGTLFINGVAAGINDTFTQAQINAGQITYDHNGSETITDSFDFDVDDGDEDGTGAISATFNFNITPSPSTAALTVTTNGNETGPVDITYTVTLDRANNTGSAITFDIDDLGAGSATSGDDYTAIAGGAVISVADGATTGTFTVTIIDDLLLEANTETVSLTISNPSSAEITSITSDTAVANITDNDTANAVLSVTTNGTEAGPTNIVYTVTLDKVNNTGVPITFDLASSGGTATSGLDYVAIPGGAQISVAAAASTGTFTVTVNDDALVEALETMEATISNSSDTAVTITTASATANITDNDSALVSISANDATANETAVDNGQFTVDLGAVNNTGGNVTVNYTVTGTATPTADYTALSGSVVVANGQQFATIDVSGIVDDVLLEADETVIVTLNNTDNASFTIDGANDDATVTINDNDTANAVLSVTTNGTEAGPTNIVYTVTLDKVNNTGVPITFDLASSGGTATSGLDYVAIPVGAQISVAAGASTGTFTVTVNDDALVEALETVEATISNSSDTAVTITTASATATITDNDTPLDADLSVSVNGDETGPTSITFRVDLSATNNTGGTLTYDLSDLGTGSATSVSDYAAIAGTQITVADGDSFGTVTITVVDDGLVEGLEDVDVQIASADAFTTAQSNITTANATATITDNDTPLDADLSVSVNGDETGPTSITFRVDLSATNNTGGTLTYDLSDLGTGSATSVSDYAAIAGTQITVADGDSFGTVTITVVDDGLVEGLEDVDVQIASADAFTTAQSNITTANATATITDNDTPLDADLSVSVNGDETGPTSITFRVDLSATNNTGGTLTYDLSDLGTGSATSVSDYAAIAGTQITVADGDSFGTVTITVVDDGLVEGLEDVDVQIASADAFTTAQSNITTANATATITDNDTPLDADLSVSVNGDETGPTSITFRVDLSATNNTGGTLTYDLSDLGTGSATSVSDYAAIAGTQITVADGDSFGTVTITVVDDGLVEGLEDVDVQIASADAFTTAQSNITTANATATITDNDTPLDADLSVSVNGDETGPTSITFRVDLSATNNTGGTLTYDLSDLGTGSATSVSDYAAIAGTQITVADGDSFGTVTITVVDDGLVEGLEDVDVQIASADAFTTAQSNITTANATATITDNDTPLDADLSVSVNGDETGPTSITFRVDLSATNNTGGTLTYDLSDLGTGSATSVSDYAAIAGTQITVADGDSFGTVTITVVDDGLVEGLEDVDVQIASADAFTTAQSNITTANATATITDNDTPLDADLSVSVNGDETGPTSITFRVDLSATNNTGGTLTYDLSDLGTGSATSVSDYAAIAGTQITVADGDSFGTVTITVVDDGLVEGLEDVDVQIASADAFTTAQSNITTANATATITDNDTPLDADLSVSVNGDETGPTSITFRVDLSATNNTGGTLTYDLSDLGTGSATSVSDYAAIAGTQITVADGDSFGTVTITVVDDGLVEGLEDVDVQIASADAFTTAQSNITTANATATITDNDTPLDADLSVSVNGDETGPTSITFRVDLSATNNTGGTLTYDLSDLGTGSATSVSDYAAIAGTQITVADGDSFGTVTITVVDDGLVEGLEDVDVQIASADAFTTAQSNITTANATATITDNDTPLDADLSVSVNGDETGPTSITFRVDLSATNNTGGTLTYDLSDLGTGSATSVSDYAAIAGTQITVADGDSFGTVTITVVDDGLVEGLEDVDVQIASADAFTTAQSNITTANATATITDNDTPLDADLSVSVNGDETGPTSITFRVDLSATNNTGGTLTYDLSDLGTGSATSVSDYAAIAGTQITVADGDSFGTVTITVVDDGLVEGLEDVDVQIASADAFTTAQSNITTANATATITDNDTPLDADLSVSVNGDETGPTSITFRVDLSATNNTGGTLTYDLSDLGTGSATSVSDYAAIAGTQITVADGDSFGTVTITVVDDGLVEGLEDVDVQIASADAFTTAQSNITTANATATITDNDTPLDADLSVSVNGDETGPTSITFRVDLSATNNTGGTLTYDLSDLGTGSATSVSDYAAIAGTQITVADGDSFGTVTITVVDDGLVEGLEDVDVQIASADAFTTAQSNITTANATATITDNDTPLDADLSVSVNGDETGPTSITFRVDLSATNNTGGTLTYDLSDLGTGSATSVSDYAAIAGTQITVADGDSFGTVTITVVDDGLVEGLEDVDVQIASADAFTTAQSNITTANATATITDNDTPLDADLSVSVNGDETGPTSITFRVDLSATNNTGGTLTYDLSDLGTGSATSVSDYAAIAGTQITVADGDSFGTVTITVVDDGLVEGLEDVDVQIASADAFTTAQSNITTANATATITDNDTPLDADLSVSVNGDETGPTSITFRVDLSATNNTGGTLTYDLSDLGTGSATSVSDYAAIAGTQITVADGDSFGTVTITVVDDGLVEGLEDVDVQIASADAFTTAQSNITTANATATITDNDTPLDADLSVSVNGDETGPTSITFRVDLSATNNTGGTLTYDLSDLGTGSATSVSDYAAIAGTQITVADGDSFGTVTITVVDDGLVEGLEDVDVQIASADAFTTAQSNITTANATATITDNDTPLDADLSVSVNGDETGPTSITFRVDLSATNNTGGTLTYDLSDLGTGSATSVSDYAAIAGTQITVADGDSFGTVTITVVDDGLVEGLEDVDVQIASADAFTTAQSNITTANATATITDNDTPLDADLSVSVNGDETGPTSITFRVDLSATNNTGGTLTYDLSDLGTGSATSVSDYAAIAGTQITVADGDSFGTVTITVVDDGLVEGLEDVDVQIASADAFTTAQSNITTANATATITDNDTPLDADLSVSVNGDETGPTSITFRVDLSATNNTGGTLTYDLSDLGTGSATSVSDYAAIAGTQITVADGDSFGTVTITVVDDGLVEGLEDVDVQIASADAFTTAQSNITTANATATITDNDTPLDADLSVSVNGDETGPTSITFRVDLSATNNTGGTLTYDLSDLGTGSATSVSDYAAIAGTQITVADGDSFGTVTITVVDDGLVEGLEDVDVQIASADAFTTAQSNITTANATATITDNDTPLDADLSVSVNGDETGPTSITFRVDLSATNNTGGTLTYDLSDLGTGSATSVSDYAAIAGTQITVADGDSFGTVTITVVDDGLVEGLEDVDVQIASADAFTTAQSNITTANATATITDNDTPLDADLSVSVNGDETGPTSITFRVDLSATNNTGGTLTYDLSDLGTGSATSVSDYAAIAGTQITVADGDSFGTVTITVVDDGLVEGLEDVDVQIASADAFTTAQSNITTANATATITDNDTPLDADLSVSVNGDETGPTSITFRVDLSATNNTGGTLTYDLSDLGTGSATSVSDYAAIAGTQITVADGDSFGTVTITVVDDGLVEGLEDVDIQIASADAFTTAQSNITTANATATITDNDTPLDADLSVSVNGDETGPTSITFRVDLSATNNTGGTLTYDLSDLGTGSATSVSDYAAIAGTQITVADGDSFGTVTITVVDDGLVEGLEDVDVQIASADAFTTAQSNITTANATATITDNDTPLDADLSVSVNGDETGPTSITFRVDLSATNNTGGTLTYDLSDLGTGSATSVSDYAAIAGTQITVADGDSFGTVTITVVDDGLVEGLEDVDVQIASADAFTTAQSNITTANATATITDNDTPLDADLSVSVNGDETGPTSITFRVDLSATNNTGGTLTYDLSDLGTGSATSVSDYAAIAGTQITVADGDSFGTVTITVVDDGLVEGLEDVDVQIASADAFTTAQSNITTANATATITDNDTPLDADLSVSVNGDETGPTSITFRVDLSATNNTGGTLTYDLSDLGTGSATSVSDYAAIAGTQITVADGDSFGTVTITVVDDGLVEGLEDVDVQIASADAFTTAQSNITTANATATITDNESPSVETDDLVIEENLLNLNSPILNINILTSINFVQQDGVVIDTVSSINQEPGVSLNVPTYQGSSISFSLIETGDSDLPFRTGNGDEFMFSSLISDGVYYLQADYVVRSEQAIEIETYKVLQLNGDPLPSWMILDSEDGLLLSGRPSAVDEIIQLRFEIKLSDGTVVVRYIQVNVINGEIIALDEAMSPSPESQTLFTQQLAQAI